ncbi:MAG: hypothetical protein NUV80_01130 [Candidatus Berkelbacteria bacterium]|nr:hypothetical protein [Candidatus Berkelbacteria bacterium]
MRKYWLAVLVWWNYKQRERGILLDEWFWADRELFCSGYYIESLPFPKKLNFRHKNGLLERWLNKTK